MLQDFNKFMGDVCRFKRAAFRSGFSAMQDIPDSASLVVVGGDGLPACSYR